MIHFNCILVVLQPTQFIKRDNMQIRTCAGSKPRMRIRVNALYTYILYYHHHCRWIVCTKQSYPVEIDLKEPCKTLCCQKERDIIPLQTI